MKTIKYMQQFFLAVAFTAGLTACSSEEDFVTTSTSEITDANITIGTFPTFNENAVSRAIGTEDAGKTAWTDGDVVLLKTIFFTDAEKSTKISTVTNELTFDGSKWTLNKRIYWPDNAVTATVVAYYAPNYELNQSGTLTLKNGKTAGTCELLSSEEIGVAKENMKATIAFQSRNYSRLRVATDPGRTLVITSATFTAIDGTTPIANGLEVTADAQGNILLYGTWTSNAKLTVKVEDNGKAYTLVEKDMSTSIAGKSYAADAIMNTATDCTKWGSGTTESPYLIANAAQLADMATKVNEKYYSKWICSFLQIADIDLSSVCSEVSNSWTPIGINDSKGFNGTYDGGNHNISRLYVNYGRFAGLFGYIDGGIVKNIKLTNASVNCTSTECGGIVGKLKSGSTIANCSNAASINSTDKNVGGIVGSCDGIIVGCSNTGSIKGSSAVGGITGNLDNDGSMVGCSNTGTVTNTSDTAGGLIGSLSSKNVYGCFTTGTVSGSGLIGSVIGYSDIGSITTIYYVSQDNKWCGSSFSISTNDVTVKTLAEMNETATVNSLNASIKAWNDANADKQCNYHFVVGIGTATPLPVIVEGAPE